ncbi:glutathione transferase GstA [Lysobacter solisilvae (ex Woo and Kim 2020)]|uniref:Glutathione transferase GstA n=1 Tax=Agrilutibacter terrestris TaxID=2865112 RepID=A0A7H0FXS9_9GAMM|nr:glutathione transferase GstA [Lysobacter terrestris]QNP40845.1 glutathione transferase GstA [Lysobacter terrestris]
MKLYYSPGACSLSPHIVARELGIDLQLEKVDTKAKQTETGRDFLQINPKGYVPTLQLDNGDVLTEGTAIVQYLADRKPEAKLAPANGTFERSRLQETLGYISTELHKTYSPLFNPTLPAEVRQERKDYLRKRYGLLEQTLAKQPYLLGDDFTVADAYLFTVTNWAGFVDLDLSEFKALNEFQQRVASRPATQAALEAEGLITKQAA